MGVLVILVIWAFGSLGVLFGDALAIFSSIAALITGLVTGIPIALLAIRSQRQRRAFRVGVHALLEGYASSRSMTREDPIEFHRRFIRVRLPSPARHVLRGTAAGGREARLVVTERPGEGIRLSLVDLEGEIVRSSGPLGPAEFGPEALDALWRG